MWASLIIIIILSIGIACYFHREAIECLPFSIFSLIFILYFFGILGSLILGLYVIYTLTLICFIYIVSRFIHNRKDLKKMMSWKLLFFVLLIIFLSIMLAESRIVCYDEFTAWGLFSKSMFFTDQLYLHHEFPVLAKSYPSATALFQYFVTKTHGAFSETLLPLSMNALFFSMTLVLIKSLKLKNIVEILLRVILLFLIPLSLYMWPSLYYTILVDFILGITFGYILFYYFTNKFDKFTFLNIALAIFFLTCSKGNGLILAILAITLIYFDIFFYNRKNLTNLIFHENVQPFLSKINYKNLLISLSPIIVCAFTYLSWSLALKILDIKSYDTDDLLNGIFDPAFKTNVKLYLEIVKTLLEEYRYFNLSVLILGSGIISTNWDKIKKTFLKKNIILVLLYALCLCIYILFLFIVCNTIPTTFLATQALRRYLFTLVATNILLISSFYIYFWGKKASLSITLILIVVIWFTTPAERQFQEFIKGDYTSQYTAYRKQYDEINKIVEFVHPENDMIYFVGIEEIDPLIANFNTFPITISKLPLWSADMSYDEYRQYLSTKPKVNLYPINTDKEKAYARNKQNGDLYLYVYKTTEEFILRHKALFNQDIEEEMFYKIDLDEESISFIKKF